MYRYHFVLLLLMFSIYSLSAQDNHMDIMTTMTGEHDWALMGYTMTTLDWNGDGYDDLIINQNGWRPAEYIGNTSVRSYGKLNIYLGGTNFDNIPEITIPGSYQQEFLYTNSLCNAGDMNGDGIDDLALFRATMYEGNNNQNYDLQLCIFYGGAAPDTIPDYVLTFPREEWDNGYCYVRGLGDINHDGFDDIGYYMVKIGYPYQIKFGIIYGGRIENTSFREISNIQDTPDICSMGDVNGDGIDDFCTGYGYGSIENVYHRIVLYFGNSSGINYDSLEIEDTSNFISSFSYPAGDVNGDGNADFVSSFTVSNAKLYFGGTGFNGTNYVYISPPYHGDSGGEGFGHGDVNGNGTDDLMGTFVSQANGFGDAYLWIGGNVMYGTPDMYIPPPGIYTDAQMFGFCLTMGDYNGDDYCDAAISAPFNYSGTGILGRVFVYAGNNQLTPNSDDIQTPAIAKLQLFPNPLQPSQSNLNVNFTLLTPLPPSSRGVSTFEIYNIRGQKVKSFTISAEQSKTGSANYNLNDLSTGVYICVLIDNKQQIKGKITIIR